MKKTFAFAWFLAVAASSIVASATAGGATLTWDGGGTGGTDFGTAVNWTTDVLPSPVTPDTAQWDGTVAGNLSLVYSNTAFAGAAGNTGINLATLATQTGSVSIDSGANTGSARLNNVTLATSSGAFTLGDGLNSFAITLGGVGGQTHTWTNDSTNGATVNSDVVLGLGGGGVHTLALGGAGNWTFNNSLNLTGLTISKAGAGTATLNGTTNALATLSVSAGTIDLKKDVSLAGTAIVTGAGGSITSTGGGKILLNVAGGDLGVANGGTLNISAIIANGTQSSIDFWNTASGTGIVNLTADNTFDGTTNLQSGIIVGAKIGDGGVAGPFGKNATLNIGATTSASTLRYTGTGETTNRVINLAGTTGGAAIDQSGTGLLKFTSPLTATGAGAKVFTILGSTAGTGEVAGAIINSTGTTGLTKNGTNTWTTSGANTYTGQTRVTNGVLNYTGTLAAGGLVYVADTLNTNSTLKISNNFTAFQMFVGDNNPNFGAVYQTAGNVAFTQAAGIDNLRIGSAANGKGYYKISAGTLTANEMAVGASLANTVGILDVTGGTVTSNGYITVGRGSGTSSGVLNVNGGNVEFSKTAGAADSGAGRLALNWANGAGAQSILNITNGSVTGDDWIDLANANTAGTQGIINLLAGGSLTGSRVIASNANPLAFLNFNGGTLKANATNAGAGFMPGTNLDGAYVYGSGGTIDNNSSNITVGAGLLAPTDQGVTTIPVADGGSGYLGAPMLAVTGGTGSGATAIANMVDDGTGKGTFKVGSVTITSRGNYTVAPTTVTPSLAGATTAATFGTITTAANTSGGMAFNGTGITTLSGTSTYSGATTVSAGTLNLTGTLGSGVGTAISSAATFTESATGVIAGGSSLSVTAGTANIAGTNTYTGATNITGGSLTLSGSGTINGSTIVNVNGTTAKLIAASSIGLTAPVDLTKGIVDGTGTINTVTVEDGTGGVVSNGNGTNAPLTINNLTFNGAGAINVNAGGPGSSIQAGNLVVNGVLTLNATNSSWVTGSTYNLLGFSNIAGTGSFALGTITGLGARQIATLDQNSGVSVALVISGDVPVWTGALSNEWSTNVLGTPKNWVLQNNGTQTDFLANDGTVFGDGAVGSTSINIVGANVSPSSMQFTNSSKNYSISSTGSFGIVGPAALVKTGTGQVTLNTTNTYAGGTQISDGQININNASAIGTGLFTIAGGSLDNTSGSAITLSTNNTQHWDGDVNFLGSNSLNLGTGAVALSATRTVTVGGGTLTVGGAITGTGAINKAGAGTLVLGGAGTYNGGVFANAGGLVVNSTTAIGSGVLHLAGATTLDNTSAGAIALANNNAQSWESDFTFTGTQSLSFGTGAVTIAGTGTDRIVNVAANSLTVGSIAGPAFGLVKNGAGTLSTGAAGASTIGGMLTVNAGKLQIGANDFTANGGLTGAGTIENGSTIGRWLFITNNANNTFSGVLQNGGTGGLGLQKSGTGTLTLPNVNTLGERVTVAGGLLNITGSVAAGLATAPSVTLPGGGVRVGPGATLTTTSELWLASADGQFGSLTIDGGAVTVNNWMAFGRGGGNGVLNHNGGTLNVATNNLTLGSFGGSTVATDLHGVATLRGSSVTNVTSTTANQGNVYVGENTSGVLTVMDDAQLNVSGALGVQIGKQNTTLSTGIMNLNGGVVLTSAVSPGTGSSRLNLNGGILQAKVANAAFMTGLGRVNVRENGAIIDTNGFAITVAQPLLAPSGSGVSASGLTVSGSGYYATPVVQISGGGGTGATAVANIDGSGNLTGITMTNAGIDYTSAPTFTLVGGGGSGTIGGTATLVTNLSGPLTAFGAGTLTLSGTNTYDGATHIGNSSTTNVTTVVMNNVAALGSTANGTVLHGVLGATGTNGTTLQLGAGIVSPVGESLTIATGDATQRASLVVAGTTDAATWAGPIVLSGDGRAQLCVNGSGGGSLTITGNITGSAGVGLSVRGGVTASTGFINGTVSIGTSPFLKTDNNVWTINTTGNTWGSTTVARGTLKLGIDNALPVTTGVTMGEGGATAVLDLNGKNQTITGLAGVAGSTAITVTSATASTLTVNNVLAQTYGNNGGVITGAVSLVKSGVGTLTLSGANTYTGNTTVTGGSLSIASAFLADGADVKLSSGVTLDLNFTGTDVIDELYINGVAQLGGTWGAVGSGADHESALITGTGKLSITTAGPGGSGSAFDTWASDKGLTTGNNGKGDNPDNDALNNLGEFAFDGNPLSGVRAGKVSFKVAPIGGVPYPTLTIPVRGSTTTFSGSPELVSGVVDGIFYHVQGSTDLGTFTGTVVEVTGTDATNIQSTLPTLSTGWFYHTFRSQNPVSGASRSFLRAKVTE